MRVRISPRTLLICRVDREADGARLESELSEIRHTGSNPVPYAIYIVAHSNRSLLEHVGSNPTPRTNRVVSQVDKANV